MKNDRSHIFVFAGEKSGDLHGSHLVKAFTNVSVEGIAGPKMREQGVKGPLVMEDFEVMGFTDVLWALPRIFRYFYLIRDYILKTEPSATILIDYPGFNLRMAKALRKKGYRGKIVQYVSPTVWAHGKDRIDEMVKTLDLLLVIYPFEIGCFKNTVLNVSYVGNPLCEYIKNHPYDEAWKSQVGLPLNKTIIALFPGSRSGEIKRNLPIMIGAAKMILNDHPDVVFACSCGHKETEKLLNEMITEDLLRQKIHLVPRQFTYELMRDSRSAMAKSGTITLELALHQRPTVVIYMVTRINRLYVKYVLKLNLPHYCIVNILKRKTVFPELIENGLSSQNLFRNFQAINHDGSEREYCLQACKELQQELQGEADTSQRAANEIEKLMLC